MAWAGWGPWHRVHSPSKAAVCAPRARMFVQLPTTWFTLSQVTCDRGARATMLGAGFVHTAPYACEGNFTAEWHFNNIGSEQRRRGRWLTLNGQWHGNRMAADHWDWRLYWGGWRVSLIFLLIELIRRWEITEVCQFSNVVCFFWQWALRSIHYTSIKM